MEPIKPTPSTTITQKGIPMNIVLFENPKSSADTTWIPFWPMTWDQVCAGAPEPESAGEWVRSRLFMGEDLVMIGLTPEQAQRPDLHQFDLLGQVGLNYPADIAVYLVHVPQPVQATWLGLQYPVYTWRTLGYTDQEIARDQEIPQYDDRPWAGF
jgi:hypothetical protein